MTNSEQWPKAPERARRYILKHIWGDYSLYTETREDGFHVKLSIDDVEFQVSNPLTVAIHRSSVDGFTMTVGGLTVHNIPESETLELSKVLGCVAVEKCDKCREVAPLDWDGTGEFMFICQDCA